MVGIEEKKMIKLLFHFLLLLVLLISILIIITGGAWVLSLELNEMLDVDVLWNVKRKVRRFIYGEKDGRLQPRRAKGYKANPHRSNIQRLFVQKRKSIRTKIQKRNQETAE